MEQACIYEVSLVQDTPMIHFQADEWGAGPRASEIKPKLDRFIVQWCRRDTEHHIKIKANWYIDKKKHSAFNYKMQVIIQNPDEKQTTEGKSVNGMYFGKGKAVFYPKKADIRLRIICFVPELMDTIRECITVFFAVHNFGTRQNKGLGGFSVSGLRSGEANSLMQKYASMFQVPVYKISYRAEDKRNIMKDVKLIYSLLKSGINDVVGGDYFKSYLTRYFLKKHIYGEKRFLKQNKIAPAICRSGNRPDVGTDEPGAQYRYIRSVLGLSGQLKFKRAPEQYKDVVKINIKHDDVKKKMPKKYIIERFPSPLLFKVIGSTMYLLVYEPDEKMFGQSFLFWQDRKGRDMQGKADGYIITPKRNEFSMKELMEGFVEELNTAEQREKIKGCRFIKDKLFITNGYQIETL